MLVEITRGPTVESVHEVDVAVVDASGSLVSGAGDPDRGVLARSALKPIQAVPLVSSGAANALDVSDEELALACASHNGEPGHVEAVTAWLGRLGFNVGHLECGSQRPGYEPASLALAVADEQPDATHNNCSGKHTGFLAVCLHNGIDPAGYIRPDHPLQFEYVTPAIAEFCSFALGRDEPGIDGCGIPVWEMPLEALARGWSRLPSDPAGLRLIEAMRAHPWLVAGTNRSDTTMMSSAHRPIATKVGAEGVHCAVALDEGVAVAVKARDGASRAAEAAMWAMLDRLGLAEAHPKTILNRAGTVVGEIRVVG